MLIHLSMSFKNIWLYICNTIYMEFRNRTSSTPRYSQYKIHGITTTYFPVWSARENRNYDFMKDSFLSTIIFKVVDPLTLVNPFTISAIQTRKCDKKNGRKRNSLEFLLCEVLEKINQLTYLWVRLKLQEQKRDISYLLILFGRSLQKISSCKARKRERVWISPVWEGF